MPKIHKTIADARANLEAAIAFIPDRYKRATSRAIWAEPAASDQARANYEAGVMEAIAEGRREAGIREAGDAKYRKGTAEKGARVIGERIRAALGDYERFFKPVLDAMCAAADAAPPRTRDPMVNIDQRLKPVVSAAIGAKKRR